MRYRESFTLLRRKGAKVYYYRLGSDPTRRARSTGKALKHEAKEYVEQLLARKALSADVDLAKFLEPYYNWETCPHVTRLRAEKKQVGEQHVRHQRALLDKYVLTDAIAHENIHELRRHHILDFRQRLLTQGLSDRQANRIIGALKTCLKEGVYREELDRDPTAGIGNIRQKVAERGVFTQDELRQLFPREGVTSHTNLTRKSHAFLDCTFC